MKVVAIIQARMGSTRLPGKVMKSLCGKTVLSHVIARVQACPYVDEVVVATTTVPQDDVIVKESEMAGAKVFRGSEGDVLSRYYEAAKETCADIVVRVTSDCPLFDPQVLSRMITLFLKLNASQPVVDYLGNSLESSFPVGLGAEIFSFVALEKASIEATKEYEREHVTPYIYLNPELFAVRNFANDEDLSFHRWTLDTSEDFELITTIYERLGKDGELFSTKSILDLFLKEPQLINVNSHVHQKQLGE
ncbi:MAG: glycosyltransferase family protein [Proteobacteria bacterium]|nr:glycosyltransferase family protein [Pseudomonadota bacterium]MBU1715796.1 glycosyltransferase family protein [Pseudomonadota bacterium]